MSKNFDVCFALALFFAFEPLVPVLPRARFRGGGEEPGSRSSSLGSDDSCSLYRTLDLRCVGRLGAATMASKLFVRMYPVGRVRAG